MPTIGIVCVHFHAAELAARALSAVRATASALETRAVVVDNGSTAEERRILETCGARVVSSGGNKGYAAGVNLGAEILGPSVDVLVFMNPDVLVLPGCLQALVSEIETGAAVAGPRFFWDRPGGYQLPPTERVGRGEELLRILAERSDRCSPRARGAWRRHAQRHWSSGDALASHDLSGALMAIDQRAWQRVGPFDEGYRLYFEETDWLVRCARQGGEGRFVGRAHAVHLYAQSTPAEPRSRAWFAESQERFRRRHYGSWFCGLLKVLSQGPPRPPVPGRSAVERLPILNRESPVPADARWLEVSPSPLGFPAAALDLARAAGEPRPQRLVSEDLWGQMAPGEYILRSLDAAGGERVLGRLSRPATP